MEQNGDPPMNAPEESPKEITSAQEPASLPVKEIQKRSKKEERQHKKEDKAVEQFLKSLDSIPSADEKLSLLSKKFSGVADENRRLQAYIKQSEKRFTAVLKEKEQLQLEYNRTVLVKSKLENLCRELQKQNKTIKEESLLRIREEEERRKETQAKFQSALSEITALLQQNNDKSNKLRDDNINMSAKFRGVLEKYELREQQVEKMAKQMSLEQQLADAKLAKAGLEAQAERERLSAEIAQLKLELGQYHARIVENQGTEASLRGQLAIYTDKYDEFQNALVKSNQVFGGFKGEMEKMSKKIVKLEKECISWKKRWESSQVAMLEMAEDKRQRDEGAAVSERKLAQLGRLCRSMQAERTLLMNTLKEHKIEPPPMPVLPPAPPTPVTQPSAPNKVDAMAANCVQLKQSLAQLQNQLNVLTSKKEEQNQTKAEPPATKSKKGKGKKSKAEKEKSVPLDTDKSEVDVPQETDKSEHEVSKASFALEDPKPLELTISNEVTGITDNIVNESKDESGTVVTDSEIITDSTELTDTAPTNDNNLEGIKDDTVISGVEVVQVNGETNGKVQLSNNTDSKEISESESVINKDSALNTQIPDEKTVKPDTVEPTPVSVEVPTVNVES